jgi:hypothetical protein
MKKFFLTFLLILVFSAVVGQEKKYGTKNIASANKTFLCVMDKSTGFIFNKDIQAWEPHNFKVEDQKFILELDTRKRGIIYRFGSNYSHRKKINSRCKKTRQTGFVECSGWLGDVHFSLESNLITHSLTYGYTVDSKSVWASSSLTPSISIGKCSQLDINTR